MSLAIDVDKVTRVLLADGWHEVIGESFSLDAYEYVWHSSGTNETDLVHGGGHSGVCATGFCFRTTDHTGTSGTRTERRFVAGPLTAILAVEYRP